MKKLLNLCLVVTLMLNVIACGAKDNTSAPSSSGETVNSTVSTEENKQPEQKPETIPTAPTTQPEANLNSSRKKLLSSLHPVKPKRMRRRAVRRRLSRRSSLPATPT